MDVTFFPTTKDGDPLAVLVWTKPKFNLMSSTNQSWRTDTLPMDLTFKGVPLLYSVEPCYPRDYASSEFFFSLRLFCINKMAFVTSRVIRSKLSCRGRAFLPRLGGSHASEKSEDPCSLAAELSNYAPCPNVKIDFTSTSLETRTHIWPHLTMYR